MTGQQARSRLAKGSGVILRGLTATGEWREALARWFLVVLVGSLAVCAVALHPWLAPLVLLAWCGAATAAAGPTGEQAGDQEDDEDDDEPPLDEAAFVELVHDVARGGNVHLSAIRLRLAEELPDYEWTAPDVTALCEAAGIPTRKGVRVPGARPAVTTGIHRGDLPPLPRPLPGTPVGGVGAGGDANNNTNTATIEHVGQGAMIVRAGPSTRQEARR